MFTVHFKSIKYALKPSCSLSSINNKMYLTHIVYTKKGTTFPQYLTNVSTTIAKLKATKHHLRCHCNCSQNRNKLTLNLLPCALAINVLGFIYFDKS